MAAHQLAMRGGVLLGELGRHPTTLGDGETLAASPFANLSRLPRAALTAAATAAATRRAAARSPGRCDEGRERLAQLAPVALADVDLVGGAVEPEGHGLGAGSFVRMQIANKNDLNSLCHFAPANFG